MAHFRVRMSSLFDYGGLLFLFTLSKIAMTHVFQQQMLWFN